MDVRVRRGGPDDLAGAASVHRAGALAGFAHIYPPEAPKPTLADLTEEWHVNHARIGSALFVAEAQSGAVVGAVLARPCADRPGDGEVARLYVEPERWGAGVGRLLHDAAVGHLAAAGHRAAVLWVLEDNTRARGWYERLGWTLTDEVLSILPEAGIVDVRYRLDLEGPDGPEGATGGSRAG